MRDYDVDLEAAGDRHRPDRRDHQAEGDHTHIEVSRALESRSAAALGTQAMLHLQRAAGNAGTAALVGGKDDEESTVQDVVASSGRPLEPEVKTDMESRLGADFSDVEVHTDAKAADSARSVSAQAYTVGNHVVFGDGKYQPASGEGRHMIAHELTHVVQQRNGPVDGTPVGDGVKVSDPGDRFEREADQTASAALSAGDAGLQRQEEEEPEEELQAMAVQRAEEEEEELGDEAPAVEEPATEVPAEEMEEDQV